MFLLYQEILLFQHASGLRREVYLFSDLQKGGGGEDKKRNTGQEIGRDISVILFIFLRLLLLFSSFVVMNKNFNLFVFLFLFQFFYFVFADCWFCSNSFCFSSPNFVFFLWKKVEKWILEKEIEREKRWKHFHFFLFLIQRRLCIF